MRKVPGNAHQMGHNTNSVERLHMINITKGNVVYGAGFILTLCVLLKTVIVLDDTIDYVVWFALAVMLGDVWQRIGKYVNEVF